MQKYNIIVIGTDDDKAIDVAIKKTFPDAVHVICIRHMKQNIERHMIDKGFRLSFLKMVADDLFSERGFMLNPAVHPEEALNILYAKWDSEDVAFSSWFKKYQECRVK